MEISGGYGMGGLGGIVGSRHIGGGREEKKYNREVNIIRENQRLFELSPENQFRDMRIEGMQGPLKDKFYELQLTMDNLDNLSKHVHLQLKNLGGDVRELKDKTLSIIADVQGVQGEQERSTADIQLIANFRDNKQEKYSHLTSNWHNLVSRNYVPLSVPSTFFDQVSTEFKSTLDGYKDTITQLAQLKQIQMQGKEAEIEVTSRLLGEVLEEGKRRYLCATDKLIELGEHVEQEEREFIELARRKGKSDSQIQLWLKEQEEGMNPMYPSNMEYGNLQRMTRNLEDLELRTSQLDRGGNMAFRPRMEGSTKYTITDAIVGPHIDKLPLDLRDNYYPQQSYIGREEVGKRRTFMEYNSQYHVENAENMRRPAPMMRRSNIMGYPSSSSIIPREEPPLSRVDTRLSAYGGSRGSQGRSPYTSSAARRTYIPGTFTPPNYSVTPRHNPSYNNPL